MSVLRAVPGLRTPWPSASEEVMVDPVCLGSLELGNPLQDSTKEQGRHQRCPSLLFAFPASR